MKSNVITAVFLAAITSTPVFAEGFYFGLGASALDTNTDGTSGSGRGVGVVAGYRLGLSEKTFLDAEIAFSKLDGSTSTGNSTLKSSATFDLGVGTYLSDTISLTGYVGYVSVKGDHVTLGKLNNTGGRIGVGIGYDISEKDTIQLRAFRSKTSNPFATTHSNIFGIGYVHRY